MSQDSSAKIQIRLDRSTRNAWLKSLYQHQLVDTSEYTFMLSDKLFFANEMTRLLGANSFHFLPQTIGLKSLAGQKKWLNSEGKIIVTRQQIQADLLEIFPFGFIVKPSIGHSSGGSRGHFYLSEEHFLDAFFASESQILAWTHPLYVHKNPTTGRVSSGEALVFQDHILRMGKFESAQKARKAPEVRLHTYEKRVVQGASDKRWRWNFSRPQKEALKKAENFANQFLALLPNEKLAKQAWSMDLIVLPNLIRIVDINTNQGHPVQWSGSLVKPKVLQAYTRHLEKFASVQFTGFYGALVRMGFGNQVKFLKKRFIERIF